MSNVQILVIVAFSAAGAIVQGSVGVGLALVAGPALVAVDPAFAPGPLLLAGQVIGSRHLLMERRHLDRSAAKNCLLGLPFGMALGLLLLTSVSERTMAITVGGGTALSALALLCGAKLSRSSASEIGTGAVTAFSSITAGLPGPPLVVGFSDMRGPVMRATSATFILVVAAIGFVALTLSGNFGSEEARLLLWMLPGVFVGLVAARWVRPYLDQSWFRPVVLSVAFLGGVALLARQVI